MLKSITNITEIKPVILVFGPTAVGKTALLEELPEGLFEVINADSQQVYRYLDIGTAKPEPGLMEKIPHHLVDIRDPDSQFNVSDFIKLCDEAVAAILRRGRIPVICGGTAFYFKNYLYGLPQTPPSDPAERQRIALRMEQEGLPVLYEELRAVDPAAAEKIKPGDSYRVQRALEVFYSSGKPLSSYKLSESVRKGLHPLIIGLRRDRSELYSRIDERVEIMARQGLLEEIRALLASGWKFTHPAMQAIGYREFQQLAECGCMSLADTLDLIKRNSRRYAKRQLTFFSSMKGIRWFHPREKEKILDIMLHFHKEMTPGS